MVVDASGLVPRDYAAEAKALACSLLEEQCGTVALFLTEMAQVGRGGAAHVACVCLFSKQAGLLQGWPLQHTRMAGLAERPEFVLSIPNPLYAQELTRDLYVKHPAPLAAAKPAPRTPRKGASSGGAAGSAGAGAADTDAASTPDQRAGGRLAAATGASGGAGAASVRCRAVALAHALDVVGPVQVSSDRLVMPAEYLRAALQQCLLMQLNEMVVMAEVGTREGYSF